ncbi:MAG: fructosamine kinase family protein, partial [Sedimenticolaceae bacterium]|nr:fructosamine kinase family protein [Sedimenticolaceae bacterium]
MEWQPLEAAVEKATGQVFRVRESRSMGGGCINRAVLLTDGNRSFFVKLNAASRLPMFEAEAAGLDEMRSAEAIRVPEPVCTGASDGTAWFVMESIPMGGPGNARLAGEQLAHMHRKQADRFGWRMDNTIGSTPQPNGWMDDWVAFWRDRRLGFQLQLAARNGYGGLLQVKGERLLGCFDRLLDHDPAPSLLHGDLWGGNIGYDENANPVIFDPAVYYGDREADLAMTELFGGFGRAFYEAYDAAWPVDRGYAVRKTLYNLYHILNHANLFGGGYA